MACGSTGASLSTNLLKSLPEHAMLRDSAVFPVRLAAGDRMTRKHQMFHLPDLE